MNLWAHLETAMPTILAALFTAYLVRGYLRKHRDAEEKARLAAEESALFSHGARAQHPQIDESRCIGCATCVAVCPEGDVLGMLGGKATIVKAHKCIGHALCADACPVGAITMTMAQAAVNSELPRLTPQYETNLPNLFIIGELGGLALIKNAVTQGRDVVDFIAQRFAPAATSSMPGIYDLIIVGAGPAGISASLRAIERNLNYVTLEEGEIGGTVARYPRQKMVLTSPVEFPLYGKFKKMELSKEELLKFWSDVMRRADFSARTGEKVSDVRMRADGTYQVTTSKSSYTARSVVLALGKSGTPRKLSVPGEDLPKVMYRLIEADHYYDQKILVVGGGDSAVEAAMALALKGNHVTVSYRQPAFTRIKERNALRLAEMIAAGKLKALFNSEVVGIRPDSVLIHADGATLDLPNDYVWVFAGGTPPNDFLKGIGVAFGSAGQMIADRPVAVTTI
jgi:thioredoxin reductase (NADPH)